MNRKSRILLSTGIAVAAIVTAYQISINTQWYHWRKVNEYRDHPRRNDGEQFLFHLSQLIDVGEVKYEEFIIDNSIPVEDTRSL